MRWERVCFFVYLFMRLPLPSLAVQLLHFLNFHPSVRVIVGHMIRHQVSKILISNAPPKNQSYYSTTEKWTILSFICNFLLHTGGSIVQLLFIVAEQRCLLCSYENTTRLQGARLSCSLENLQHLYNRPSVSQEYPIHTYSMYWFLERTWFVLTFASANWLSVSPNASFTLQIFDVIL